MKKMLSLVLMGVICLTLVGCNSKNNDNDEKLEKYSSDTTFEIEGTKWESNNGWIYEFLGDNSCTTQDEGQRCEWVEISENEYLIVIKSLSDESSLLDKVNIIDGKLYSQRQRQAFDRK